MVINHLLTWMILQVGILDWGIFKYDFLEKWPNINLQNMCLENLKGIWKEHAFIRVFCLP